MEYGRLPTVQVCDPEQPGSYLVVNMAEYGPGLLYPPDVYPRYVEATSPPGDAAGEGTVSHARGRPAKA